MFWKTFCVFIAVALVCCIIFGPASVILVGFLYVLLLQIAEDVNQTKTKRGRNQIHQEIQREREIEEYWGIIDYDEKD